MRDALRITGAHRRIALRPESGVVADLASVRANVYSSYRRRLGQDAAHLPENFATAIDDVIPLADRLLGSAAPQHWGCMSRTGSS